MSHIGENSNDMTDPQFYHYAETCTRLVGMLDQAIDSLMRHIFEGKCQNPSQWESLFKAVSQAVFMKEYLTGYCSSLVLIAQDFLVQWEEWIHEMKTNLK